MEGDTRGSAAGTYVMAALFAAAGLWVWVFDVTSRTGMPSWLGGTALVGCGLALVVLRLRRG